MLIFLKKDIVPIFVPQICFNDKYNNPNSYVEMNPSLYISENGNVSILVRCVNYRKYKSNQFTVYGLHPNSVYYIIKGQFTTSNQKLDIEQFEFNILQHIFVNM